MKPITSTMYEHPRVFMEGLLTTSNLVRLELQSGELREITRPKLGRDFLAGILEDGESFGVFRKSILRSVEFASDANSFSEALVFTPRTAGELLSVQNFPALATFSYLESPVELNRLRVRGVVRGFLVMDSHRNTTIPVAALGYLELSCG